MRIKAIFSQHLNSPYASDSYLTDDMTISYHDVPIQGKLIAARYKENSIMAISSGTDYELDIKNKLAHFIAKKMIDDKLIFFTKKMDPHSYATEYIASIFLAPDNNVRTIRIASGQIKLKTDDTK